MPASVLATAVTPLGLLDRIPFAPGPLIVVVALAVWYGRGVRRVKRPDSGVDWPTGRALAFAAGLALIAGVTLSGLASWDQTDFTVHGIIDMVDAMVAPIFLALGAPLTLAQHGGRVSQRVVKAVLQSRVGRVCLHPLGAWVIFTVSLFGLYYTPYFRWAQPHEWLLQLGHLELALAGCLLVWPVVGVDPVPKRLALGGRLAYVLFMLPYYTLFGIGLSSQNRSIAPGITAADLHGGAGVIWSAGECICICLAVGILYRWLFLDMDRAQAREAEDDAALATQMAVWRVSRLLAGQQRLAERHERPAEPERQPIAAVARERPPGELPR